MRGAREEGAVAVMVAVLSVVLVGISAFAVEFGQAYVNKRQLSTGADAAAVAAARYYATQQGDCATLSNRGTVAGQTMYNAAQALAQSYLSSNVAGAPTSTLSVACSPDNKSLWVSFDDFKESKTTLGVVNGVSGVPVSHSATAATFVAKEGSGAVPYELCINDLNVLRNDPANIQQVGFPGGCGGNTGNPAGSWYTVDCPEDSGNSSQHNIQKYCTTPITIIATTPANTDNASTEAFLKATCQGQPPTADPGCLRSNPGNIRSSGDVAFWNTLLGQTILMPVVYSNTLSGNGSGARFPVAGFAAVRVCGFHWGNNKDGQTLTSPCDASHNSHNYDASTGGNNSYLLLEFSSYISSGSSSPSGCTLGSSCDGGNRSVALIR